MMRWIAASLLLFVLALSVGCSSYSRSRYCTDSGDCLSGETCQSNYCSGGSSNSSQCPYACLGSSSYELKARPLTKKIVHLKRVSRLDILSKINGLSPAKKMVLRELFLSSKSKDPRLNELRKVFARVPSLMMLMQKRLRQIDTTTTVLRLKSTPNLDTFLQRISLVDEIFTNPSGQCTPLLQIRADRITVHNADDDLNPLFPTNDNIYCAFQAVSDAESQYLVTPVTEALGAGESETFPRSQSWVWGEPGILYYPGQLLTVHIECIERDYGAEYAEMINKINMAVKIAGYLFKGTQFGALLSTTELILDIIGEVWSWDGDDRLFQAKLEFRENELQSFANKEIQITRTGTNNCASLCEWSWSLFLHTQFCQE